MIYEKDTECYLNRKVKLLGGISLKFVSPGNTGVPDRLVMLNGKMFFVELKSLEGRPSEKQKHWKKKLEGQGVKVYYAYSKVDVNAILAQQYAEL